MATSIYVDTLRLLTLDGPAKPRFTDPLRSLLKLRSYQVLDPVVNANGQESAPAAAATSFRVDHLVLLKSTLVPPVGGSGTSSMEVAAQLWNPKSKASSSLGPYTVDVLLDASDFAKNDLKPKALERVLEELYLPMVNDIDAATP